MAKADGAAGTLGQLRVGMLADLVLRPWDTSRPPVTAELTVLAPPAALCPPDPILDGRRGAGPLPVGEVDGQPITAAHLRQLLAELDALCPGGLRAPAGGTMNIAVVDPASGALRAAFTRAELERLVRRGCLDHPDSHCTCPVLDRPAGVDRYRPTPAQSRFVRTRDRTCRQPGCYSRAAWADLDHVIPHARAGPTDCANLCCLCRRHHRLKTHADGWRFEMRPDGLLSVTTPSGVTRTTRPPGMRPQPEQRADDDPPPF